METWGDKRSIHILNRNFISRMTLTCVISVVQRKHAKLKRCGGCGVDQRAYEGFSDVNKASSAYGKYTRNSE